MYVVFPIVLALPGEIQGHQGTLSWHQGMSSLLSPVKTAASIMDSLCFDREIPQLHLPVFQLFGHCLETVLTVKGFFLKIA